MALASPESTITALCNATSDSAVARLYYRWESTPAPRALGLTRTCDIDEVRPTDRIGDHLGQGRGFVERGDVEAMVEVELPTEAGGTIDRLWLLLREVDGQWKILSQAREGTEI